MKKTPLSLVSRSIFQLISIGGLSVLSACGDMSEGSLSTSAENEQIAKERLGDEGFNALVASDGGIYLSDLNWSSMTNAWGSAEKDKSNGEQSLNDGKAIKINGKTYSKGLGVHANSEIKYALAGKYLSLISDIGVDDEVDTQAASCQGTVVFQVYADNLKVYDSGVMNRNSAAKNLQVDLKGKQELRLVVNSSTDGNACDHADWADARILPLPPVATYLSDLNWSSMTNAWGSAEKDKSNGEQATNDGKALKINGKTYTKGLGVHASSDIKYALGGKYLSFSSEIGVDDEVDTQAASCQGTVVFQVYTDGAKVYDSGVVNRTTSAKLVQVDLKNKQELRLVVTPSTDGNACDHADWADAKIFSSAATPSQEPVSTPAPAPIPNEIVIPNTPSNLSVSASTSNSVSIAWSDNSNNENSFKVERKTSGGSYQEIASVAANVSSYNNTSLAASTTYFYRVRAVNADGASDYSAEVQATTAVAPLPPITPLSGTVKNVRDYGTNANAVLAAANAAGTNGTVLFDGGVFDMNFSSNLIFPSDRKYIGRNGAILRGKNPEGHMFAIKGDNVTVSGLILEGGGIFLDRPAGGKNNNIVIDSNIFRVNSASGPNRDGIKFTSGLQNSKITNNYFTGCTIHFGIYGYNYRNLTIANNEFVEIGAGMHIDAFGDSGDLLVEQNYIKGSKGMGMEFQSTATNLVFQDNWYETTSATTTSACGPANGGTMAFSLILDKSRDIKILRNYLKMPKRGTTPNPDDYVRCSFEVGGDNTLVEDNYSDGGNHVVAMNDGVGSASVTVRNNKLINYLEGIRNSFPAPDRILNQSNNGNIRLSNTMEERISSQRKPGIGAKRYNSTTTGGGTY